MEIHAYTLYYELASTNPSSINWCHVQSNSIHDQNYFVAISYNWTLTWLYYFKKKHSFSFQNRSEDRENYSRDKFPAINKFVKKNKWIEYLHSSFQLLCILYMLSIYHVNSWNVFVFLNITFYYMQWPSMYHIRIWKLQKIHFLIYP